MPIACFTRAIVTRVISLVLNYDKLGMSLRTGFAPNYDEIDSEIRRTYKPGRNTQQYFGFDKDTNRITSWMFFSSLISHLK